MNFSINIFGIIILKYLLFSSYLFMDKVWCVWIATITVLEESPDLILLIQRHILCHVISLHIIFITFDLDLLYYVWVK